jgi:5-carboxymethyl-2-hydroxymuconic-semialdehyde dehydrogenase/aminomuconate-semialdehyde/2-hydroxymuconate-6-semialdehyde dehydrogenase
MDDLALAPRSPSRLTARPLVTAFIDNVFLPAGDGPFLPVIYPATEQQVSGVEEADASTVDRAVTAARRAFDHGPWPRMALEDRQAMLRRLAKLIRRNAEELAYLECLNSGIPMRHLMRGQIPRAAYNFAFFAEFIGQGAGQVYTQDPRYLTFVTREPVGVAALIGPWNAPLALTSMKIAGCIAFGNCCVAKPAEQTPLAVARFMELVVEAGIPPGVVNMVNGRGGVTGDALVRHDGVDLVSFTGGTNTGRSIMSTAGAGLKPCSNNGQQCLAGSRILVERSIAQDFMAAFVARARKLKIGDPMDPATEIGPLAFRAHLDRVLSFVDVALADGAELLTGGRRPRGFEQGAFMEPTAVLAPNNRTRICQEEVFGPFATFLTFDDFDEAIAIANDSRFGLVSYVWSQDMTTALQASRAIRSGVVWVNTPMVRELRAPFGGFKESGMGREGGLSSMHFYTGEKTTTMPIAPVPMARLGLG